MFSKFFRIVVASVLIAGNVVASEVINSQGNGVVSASERLPKPNTSLNKLKQNNNTFKLAQSASNPRTVYTHLFEWKWVDVARECENFLGQKGYAAVQVSPPQEHRLVEGLPWYQRYQPVSYKLESRSGTRAEFADMVRRCKKAGVDIYVDAVINHMTGVVEPGQTETGSADSRFGHYEYPDYTAKDFHRCNRNGNDDIQNWNDRYEVQNCELLNLTDLDTGSEKVRSRIATYLSDLVSLGVTGFRIDAAKHISSTDLAAILSKVKGNPYIYQEVIAPGGEPIQASEYLSTGDVTEFKYSLGISPLFRNGKLADLKEFATESTMMPSDKAMVFIDNHDNQRGHGLGRGILTYKDGQKYVLANIFMLAWPYGYPQIMSSYKFEDTSQGPPSETNGRTKSIYDKAGKNVGCFKKWVCEHRIPAIANMVGFRNYTNNEFFVSNWWSNGNNQIAFGRGNKGFVVINREDSLLSRKFQTGLPAGSYCNVITGVLTANGKACNGGVITVDSQGFANIQVPPQNAVAIYGGQKETFRRNVSTLVERLYFGGTSLLWWNVSTTYKKWS